MRLPNEASGRMPRSVSNGASLQSVEGAIEEDDPEFFPSYHADYANEFAEINGSTPSPPAYLIRGTSPDGDFNPYGQYDADDGTCVCVCVAAAALWVLRPGGYVCMCVYTYVCVPLFSSRRPHRSVAPGLPRSFHRVAHRRH